MGYNTFNTVKTLSVTPTISTSAYAAGDVIGGRIELPVSSANSASGVIRRIRMTDNNNVKAAGTLYLFSEGAPTNVADNAVFASAMTLSDLNKLFYTKTVSASDWVTLNSRAYLIYDDLPIDFITFDGKLYAYYVASGTPTYSSTTALRLMMEYWLNEVL